MDPTEIESHLDGVKEIHGRVGRMLERERNNLERAPCMCRWIREIGRTIHACRNLLNASSHNIDDVETMLEKVMDNHSTVGVKFVDNITPLLIRRLDVRWKQERLEDAYESLLRSLNTGERPSHRISPLKMDLGEIELHLDGVGERHEEVECKLVEVREGGEDAQKVLDDCEDMLIEIGVVIDTIREELEREVNNDHNDSEGVSLMARRFLEAEWRHEDLEEACEALLLEDR